MMPATLQKSWFTVAIVTAVWFALTGSFWAYYANVVLSFPFGILSAFIWYKQRAYLPKAYRIVGWVLVLGCVLSAAALVLVL